VARRRQPTRQGQAEQVAGHHRTLPPSVRGVLAIVLNPGGWLFLAAVASPLFATATERGGTTSALVATGMLVAGAALGELGLVLVASLGLRFADDRVVWWCRVALAGVLAVLGAWLLLSGARPLG
jgi:threonine/homoserine/homoserine lactone efflux protein